MISPDQILSYPLHHNETGSLHIFGDAEHATNVILMCPGYPDDQTVFYELAKRLSSSSLVGIMCLPGYDRSTRRASWTFLEMADGMQEAIHVLRTNVGPKVKLIGIFHDWGCVVGSIYANRAVARGDRQELIPDRLVLLDVLLPPRHMNYKLLSWNEVWQGMIVVLYQLPLAIAFWLDRYVSRAMSLAVLSMTAHIISLLLLKHPEDLQHLEEKQAKKAPHLAYPYYQAWKSLLTLQTKEFAYCSLPKDLAKMPVLFLQGKCKRISLHFQQGEDLLNREKGNGNRSKVAVIQNGGHWFYLHDLDECWGHIQDFLK